MITGDGAYIKKLNRGLILKKIIEHVLISRADLSKITGLNKATISVQVSSLLEDGLIFETQQEHTSVGRRPIMLSINRNAGYVLGIDFDYRKIQYAVFDLQGNNIYSCTVEPQTDDYEEIIQLLIKQIKKYADKCSDSRYGLVDVMIGVHGTVNKDESILFFPKYQWHHKNLKNELEQKIDIPVSIENNANLSAYAERVYKHHHSDNLLAIILSSGIGAGVIINGKLHKGYNGYAGEMGHMIIYPNGKPCKCGNNGCWELYSAESSFFEQLASQLNKPDLSYQDVQNLLAENDPVTYQLMDELINNLSIGLNNIINLYNPETLVLASKLLEIYPNVIDKIESILFSSVSEYKEIVLSTLGNKSCIMGACALAIQRFLEVPELILTITDDFIPSNYFSDETK